jgi:hypothetical protein|tara:strand:+ start:78 stop:401 length:324 start_codon:yes stop_codon:yes gene_type:complete
MDLSDIHGSIDKMYEDMYYTRVKVWAESMGMPGDITARRILRTPTRTDIMCRGKMGGTSKRCTRKAKCNGFCGYHRNQFKDVPRAQINWSRTGVTTTTEVPEGLVLP